MRIPLPAPIGSSLMSGFLSGGNVARSQQELANQQTQEQNQKAYQSAVLQNQKNVEQMNAPLISAKVQALADAHAISAIRHAYLAHLLNAATGNGSATAGTPSAGGSIANTGGAMSMPSPSLSTTTGTDSNNPLTLPLPASQTTGTPTSLFSPTVAPVSTPAPNNWDALGVALGIKGAKIPKASAANALSPIQKAQLGVDQAVTTAQGVAPTKIGTAVATKQLQTAEGAIPAIMQSINSLKTMKNIVNNPQEGKGFWSGGIFYPGSNLMLHLSSDADRGSFKSAGANVVAQLTKAFSQRGGAYASKMAAGFKPSLNNTAGANSGMVTNLLGHLQSELRQATRTIQAYHGNIAQYGDLSPYLDPTLPVNTYGITPATTVQVRAPDGTIHTMTYAEAQKLGAK